MKIKATQSQAVEVQISKEQIKQICEQTLCDMIKLSVPTNRWGWYVNDNDDLIQWEEQGGSHSWPESKVLRKATELDKAVYLVMSKLK